MPDPEYYKGYQLVRSYTQAYDEFAQHSTINFDVRKVADLDELVYLIFASGIISSGIGTVNYVGLTSPSELSITGSPVLASGTLGLSWSNQAINKIFAAPSGGASGVPTFRSLIDNDIPNISPSKVGNSTAQWNASQIYGKNAPSSPTSGYYLQYNGYEWVSSALTASGGGTLTSVGLTAPSEITVSNSPITTAGNIAISWANQTAAKFFASPSGSTGTPSFRTIVEQDIPSLPQSRITNLTTDLVTKITASSSDVLTNKTINADNNTVTNIGASEVTSNLITGLTEDTTPSAANDYVMSYDASAASLKKILLTNLPGASGSFISKVVPANSGSLPGLLSTGNVYDTGKFPYTAINVREYGALGDGVITTHLSTTSGTNLIGNADGTFVGSRDNNKSIIIFGAGANGDALVSTISGVIDGANARIYANASGTKSSLKGAWGTNNYTAIQSALDAARAPNGLGYFELKSLGRQVYFGNGIFVTIGEHTVGGLTKISGESTNTTIFGS